MASGLLWIRFGFGLRSTRSCALSAGLAGVLLLGASVSAAQTVPTGPMILISRLSGQCVTNPGTTATLNVQMVQKPCSGPLAEQWTMQTVTGGGYKIVSRLNNLCLAVQANSTADGAAVVQYTCNGATAQTWTPQASGSGVRFVAKNSGKCLNVMNAWRGIGVKITQAACNSSNQQRWAMSTTSLPSQWSAKITFPLVPVAVANMPDGRSAIWSAYDRLNFTPTADYGKTYTSIYDPQTGSKTDTLVTNTQHDMFCPGTTMLPDGRLLVNGGSSSAKTSIFDPGTATWSASGAMSITRGYQGNTLTSNSEVLTLGGSWSGGRGNKHAEIWAKGNWRRLPGVPVDQFIGPDPKGIYRGDNHLWLLAWSNGWVFQAGPSARMHWIDTSGDGNVLDAGPRGMDAFSMNGNAVMYDTGLVLKTGGAPAYDGGLATDSAYRINMNVATPPGVVTVTTLAPMVFPRALHNSVVLPDGRVILVGGTNVSLTFSDAYPVLMAEQWDPATGTFTRLSAMQTPRTYHGVAILLPDGRVFVGGGGLCGPSCTVNHTDAEIFTPPYLLNANGTLAPRPTIISAPSSATFGSTITVTTDTAVTRFALVRMSAVTHSVNNDQRRIPLAIVGGNAAGYTLTIPADRGVVLPGNYMLFALNSAGRPSYAKVINIR